MADQEMPEPKEPAPAPETTTKKAKPRRHGFIYRSVQHILTPSHYKTYFRRLQFYSGVLNPIGAMYTKRQVTEAAKVLSSRHLSWYGQGTFPTDDDGVREVKKALRVCHGAGNPGPPPSVLPRFARASLFAPTVALATAPALLPYAVKRFAMFGTMTQFSMVGWLSYLNGNRTRADHPLKSVAHVGIAGIGGWGIVEGVRWWVRTSLPMTFKSTRNRLILGTALPSLAFGVAAGWSVSIARRSEKTEGINVYDPEGDVIGTSVLAGKEVVWQSAKQKALAFMPCALLPRATVKLLVRQGVVSSARSWPAMLGVFAATLWISTPLSMALYPAALDMEVESLEPEFHRYFDGDGKRLDTLRVRRGL